MTLKWIVLALAVCFQAAAQPGFKPLFDGKTLNGWSNPDMSWWKVENGAITASSTPERPAKKNYYLIWQGGDVGDFELKLEFRITGDETGNAGIQFRSRFNEDATHATGYQADIDRAGKYLGALYDEGEGRRQVFANRGERVTAGADGKIVRTRFAPDEQVRKAIQPDGWNLYHVVARGHRLLASINGQRMWDVIDNDP